MLRFRRISDLQTFAAAHYSIHSHFNLKHHLNRRSNFKMNRAASLDEWRRTGAA